MEWASERDSEELVQAFSLVGVSVDDGVCGFETLFSHGLAYTFGLLLQNDSMRSFWDRKDEQYPENTGYGHKYPEYPAPAEVEADIPVHHKRQRRSKCRAETVHGHWTTGLVSSPYVAYGPSGVGQRCPTCEAADRSAYEDYADVRSEGDWELEDEESKPGDHIDGLTTEVLRQGRKENGSNCKAQNVERQSEGGDLGR